MVLSSIKKLDRKSLVYTAIVAGVLILGGIGFYLFSRAMADNAANQEVCGGLTNTAWRNCVQNLHSWRKFLGDRSNKHFSKTIEAWDNHRFGLPDDGKGNDDPTPTPTPTPSNTGTSSPSPTPSPTFTPSGEADISLSPEDGTYAVGDTINVKIILNTDDQEVSGAQFELDYDPTKLEVQDADTSKTGVQISLGNLFSTEIQNSVSGGKILIAAGSIPPAPNYNGTGDFASVRFRALTAGTAQLHFNPATTKAAKAGTGENILTATLDGSYTITAN